MKIKFQLTLIAMGFFALIIVLYIASQSVLSEQQSDGLIVNLSGRQRMLSQKMSKEALIYATNPSNVAQNQLQTTVQLFDRTLKALRNGGMAPMKLDNTNDVSVPSTLDKKFNDKLDEVGAVWTQLQTAITSLISSKGKDADALSTIINVNPKLLFTMNEHTLISQELSEKKVSSLKVILSVSVGVGLILVIVSLVVGSKIGSAVEVLTKAANGISTGEIDEKIVVTGTGELTALSMAFERMRVSLSKMMEAQDG